MRVDWINKQERHVAALYFAESMNLADVKSYEKEGIDELEIWYPKKLDDDIHTHYGDGLRYIELDSSWGAKSHSLRIDLTQSREDILMGMEKNRRYKVKRAKNRDNLRINITPLSEGRELTDYLKIQNSGENVHMVNEEKVLAMVKKQIFYLGVCKSADGNWLANHTWIVDEKDRWVFMYSSKTNYCEEEQIYGSRPASLLHYEAMLYFKEKRYEEYDFSGYCIADKETERNRKHLSVSRFKKSFGGKVVTFDRGIIIPITETKHIRDNINKILPRLKESNVILWGLGNLGKYALNVLDKWGIKPILCIDNKLADEESTYFRKDILRTYNPMDAVVLVATTFPTYKKILQEDVCTPFIEQKSIYCLCKNDWKGEF